MLTPEQIDAILDKERDSSYANKEFDNELGDALLKSKHFGEFALFTARAVNVLGGWPAVTMAVSMGYLMGLADAKANAGPKLTQEDGWQSDGQLATTASTGVS